MPSAGARGVKELLPQPAALRDLARERAPAYAAARPFRHQVLDGVFRPELLDLVLEEFPPPSDDPFVWHPYDDERSKKLQSSRDEEWGPATRRFMRWLNGRTFLRFLETLTGIEGLVSDPIFGGGGLHQIVRGGFLKIHADFNKHDVVKTLDRRLNVLVYLNRAWRESYGGHLELWDKGMRRAEARILPVFNRMVVFSTDDRSYHGHPDPLTCPPSRTRKSLALYYYTQGRPKSEIDPGKREHSTLFRRRPGERFETRF